MIDQEELPFGEAYARNEDPDTSHEAADNTEGEIASHLEKKVIKALELNPQGLTNHQIVEITHIVWNTITPRVRPLVRKGLVVDSGERRTGPTNRRCIVWKLKGQP